MMKDFNGAFIVVYWLVVMTVLASSLVYFVFGTSSGPTKRRVFRWYMGIAGILVTGWFAMLGGVMGFVVALVALTITTPICWHATRFCDACGATMLNQFMRAKFCPRCGADLDAQDRERATKDRPAA